MKTEKKMFNQNYLNFPTKNNKEVFPKLNKTTNAFLKRNYDDMVESIKETSKKKKSIKDMSYLASTLYKLKNVYNELKKESNHRAIANEHLKEFKNNLQLKILQMNNFQDMEFPREKLSVKHLSTQNESKEHIEQTIQQLLSEKAKLDEKFKNELEYSHTLEHMITNQKTILEKLNEVLILTEEKITGIKYFKKNLDRNENEKEKKKKNFSEVIKNLQSEIQVMGELMKKQDEENDKLNECIERKENEIAEIKERIDVKKIQGKEHLKIEKEKIFHEIREMEEIKKENIEKESVVIKMILGLYLVKTYFIDPDKQGKEIDTSNIANSEDYHIFLTDRYKIYDDEETFVLTTNPSDTVSTAINNPRGKITCGNYSTPPSSHQGKSSCKIYLKYIKEKYDALKDMTYEHLYEIFSKILTKSSFCRQSLTKFTDKRIFLESKKDEFIKRVKEIISNDYKNFNDLIKNNSRFDTFMRSNINLLTEAKAQRETNRDTLIYNMISESDEAGGTSPLLFPGRYKDFYTKCHQWISEGKLICEYIVNDIKGFLSDRGYKEIEDGLMRSCKVIKATSLNKISEYSKVSNETYMKNLFQYVNTDSGLYETIENEIGKGTLKHVEECVLSSNKKLHIFLSMNNQLEKVLFYFFTDIKSREDTIILLYKGFNLLLDFDFDLYHQKSTSNCKPHLSMKEHQSSHFLIDDADVHYLARATTLMSDKTISKTSTNKDYTKKDSITQQKKESACAFTLGTDLFQKKKTTVEGIPDDSYIDEKPVQITEGSQKAQRDIQPGGYQCQRLYHRDKIFEKLYVPFIEKRSYNKKLNENIGEINQMTRENSKMNHLLIKKKKEIEDSSREMIIYNNPKLNLDSLSSNTYNFYVKNIISNQLDFKKKKNKEACEQALRPKTCAK